MPVRLLLLSKSLQAQLAMQCHWQHRAAVLRANWLWCAQCAREFCTWHGHAPVALGPCLKYLTLQNVVVQTDDVEGPAGMALHAGTLELLLMYCIQLGIDEADILHSPFSFTPDLGEDAGPGETGVPHRQRWRGLACAASWGALPHLVVLIIAMYLLRTLSMLCSAPFAYLPCRCWPAPSFAHCT